MSAVIPNATRSEAGAPSPTPPSPTTPQPEPKLTRTASAPGTLVRKRSKRSGPKSKSSSFFGVSQYRRTGRWEAHIWDCAKSRGIPGAKGRQLHLGSFDCAEDAARAYDRAAIHFRGDAADTNFGREQYTHDPVLTQLKGLSKEQFVVRLRGVAQHHKIETQRKSKADKKSSSSRGAATKRVPEPLKLKTLKRAASFPMHSPHSVLPDPGRGALPPEGFPSSLLPAGQLFVGSPPAYHHSQEPLVYSSRVVDENFVLNDPAAAGAMPHHPSPLPHFPARQDHGRDGDLLFFEDYSPTVMPFPEDYSPTETTELQGLIKTERQLNHGVRYGMEDYHFDGKHCYGGVGGAEREGKPAPASPGRDRFMSHFAARDEQGRALGKSPIPPLMEGMGEVDTGTL